MAGPVTFSNFQAAPAPFVGLPVDGLGGLGANAAANADGSVSLTFSFIDAVTGLPTLQRSAVFQAVAYDVTVTDPAQVLGSVNQTMGPQTAGFNFLNHIEPTPATLMMGGAGIAGNRSLETIFVDEQFNGPFWPALLRGAGSRTAPLTAPFFLGDPSPSPRPSTSCPSARPN